MDLRAILQVEIFTMAFFEEIFRSNTTLLEPVVTCYHMFYESVRTYISRILAHSFRLNMTSSPKAGYMCVWQTLVFTAIMKFIARSRIMLHLWLDSDITHLRAI